jgi:hypothetical protein
MESVRARQELVQVFTISPEVNTVLPELPPLALPPEVETDEVVVLHPSVGKKMTHTSKTLTNEVLNLFIP